jgi:hypothetical protein
MMSDICFQYFFQFMELYDVADLVLYKVFEILRATELGLDVTH